MSFCLKTDPYRLLDVLCNLRDKIRDKLRNNSNCDGNRLADIEKHIGMVSFAINMRTNSRYGSKRWSKRQVVQQVADFIDSIPNGSSTNGSSTNCKKRKNTEIKNTHQGPILKRRKREPIATATATATVTNLDQKHDSNESNHSNNLHRLTLFNTAYEYKDVYFVAEWKKQEPHQCYPIEKVQLMKVSRDENQMFVVWNENEPIQEPWKKMWHVWYQNSPGKIEDCAVDFQQYKRVIRSPDRFQEDQHVQHSPKKWHVNLKFAMLFEKYPRSKREAVVLDSHEGLTCKLLSSFVKPEDLHVPNLDFEFGDQSTVSDFKKWATLYHCSVYEWMRDFADHETGYDFALDYTCTFQGNQTIKPQVDLQVMFEKQLLAKHHGLLWLTLSRRKPKNHEPLSFKLVDDWIQFLAHTFGYQIKCVNHDKYNKMMYWFYVTI